jgi:hypothetical protein
MASSIDVSPAYADPILKLDVFSGSIRSGKKPVVWVEMDCVVGKADSAEVLPE